MSSCGLFDLPSSAVIVLLKHAVSVSNTGQLLRLSLVCKQSMQMVASADWFWQQQCEQLGWLRPGVYHPPRAQAPNTRLHPQQEQWQQQHQQGCKGQQHHYDCPGQQQLQEVLAAPQQQQSEGPWFQYYILRMSSRWRLRTLVKKYIPFLNVYSRVAMQAGVTVQHLAAVEDKLGVRLPWELWELYRFRGGQAAGQAVTFADSCRLLELPELYLATVAAPSTPSLAPSGPVLQEQQLAALQQQIPSLLTVDANKPVDSTSNHGNTSSSSSRSSSTASTGLSTVTPAVAAGGCGIRENDSLLAGDPGSEQSQAAVVFLSNVTGGTAYCLSQDASVHILRGFTQRRVAGSLAGFLQHLLT